MKISIMCRCLAMPTLAWLAVFSPPAISAEPAAPPADRVYLSMPEPPDEFAIIKNPLAAEGKSLGFQAVVMKQGVGDKIIVTVSTSMDHSFKDVRVAALKGYVNGLAGGLKEAGFKLTEKKLPDVDKADFTKVIQADLIFENPQGMKLYVRQFMFFTDVGYNIQVAATSPEGLETLVRWAKHIRPAAATPPAVKAL